MTKKTLLGLLVSLALSSFALPLPEARAQSGPGDALGFSPYAKWRTFETAHFRLTFPEELLPSVRKAGAYLEEAHQLLAPTMHWEPSYKVQVTLVDNTDLSNGLTASIARFGIVLYVTPPENWFSIAYYDDWLRMICIHEYTHFLNMDATTDFYKPLRLLFGDVFLPNSIWPSWMLEGLAVYMETRHTRAGRGRSPYYEMVLRSAVEQNVLDNGSFVTLDRINGDNPYYPGGETSYLFGYQLMNRIAREPVTDRTADGELRGPGGDETLGLMSLRSSRRVPFLINGNLENLIGKDFYKLWDEWVRDTRDRMMADLAKIRSQPQTQVERLTERGNEILGTAISPDGHWLAWTQKSLDRRYGLYLRDQRTGATRKVADKLYGATMAFTPDSKRLVYSEINRRAQYSHLSDLWVREIDSGRETRLTDKLRARDPDVSRDGQWVVFTYTENAANGVAVAPLEALLNGDVSGVRKVFTPARHDRASTPKFSADGKSVYFSFHPNGQPRENLMKLDVATAATNPIVADGFFNRYPAVRSDGEVFFVSNRTGVDNLYRYREGKEPEIATNLTTGMAFPTFAKAEGGASDTLYGTVFSHTGWDVSRLKALEGAVSPAAITVSAANAPEPTAEQPQAESTDEPGNYSVWPSILPRVWTPILYMAEKQTYVGAQTYGFDALDLHRYYLGAAYDTLVKKSDLFALYSNRQLGPSLNFYAEETTSGTDIRSGVLSRYNRRTKFAASASFPFMFTWSNLTPQFGANLERNRAYSSRDTLIAESRYVPNFDLLLGYSDVETTALGVSPESGRIIQLGTRMYVDNPSNSYKHFLSWSEHLRLFADHTVLVPSFKASWVPNTSPAYLPADIVVEGRQAQIFNPLPNDNLDQVAIRGYPLRTFYVKAATIGALDLRFPLLRVFRGFGTNPAYLRNLYGFAFFETAYLPKTTFLPKYLPSAGAGIRATMELLVRIPLTLSLEYHKGFKEDWGGTGEAFFQAGLNPLVF